MKKEEIGPATIYCGDCMEQMGEIQDGIVDMVLCDPPYSSGGLFAGDRKKSTREKYCDDDYNGAARFRNFSGDNMDQRSFTEFMRMVLSKCRQKAKPESVCAVFVDWRNLPAMIATSLVYAVEPVAGKPGKWKIVDQEHMDDAMSMAEEYQKKKKTTRARC
mgnify:CR=1 FL=1